jgi:hypothetical protein
MLPHPHSLHVLPADCCPLLSAHPAARAIPTSPAPAPEPSQPHQLPRSSPNRLPQPPDRHLPLQAPCPCRCCHYRYLLAPNHVPPPIYCRDHAAAESGHCVPRAPISVSAATSAAPSPRSPASVSVRSMISLGAADPALAPLHASIVSRSSVANRGACHAASRMDNI